MDMAPDEIVVRYRQAKHKSEQLKILADLNACTVDEIINVLCEHGGYKPQYFNKAKVKLRKQNVGTGVSDSQNDGTSRIPSPANAENTAETEYIVPAKSVPEMLVDSAFNVIRAELNALNRQQYELDMRKAELYKKLWDMLGEVQ